MSNEKGNLDAEMKQEAIAEQQRIDQLERISKELRDDLGQLKSQISRIIRAGFVSVTGGTGAAILSGKLDSIPGLIDLAFGVFVLGLIGLLIDYLQHIYDYYRMRAIDIDQFFFREQPFAYLPSRRQLKMFQTGQVSSFANQFILALCILGIAIGIGLVWFERRGVASEGVTEQVSLVEVTLQYCIA